MPLTNFPNGVSSFGIPVVGANDDGKVWGDTFFVDATNGNNGNDGKSPTTALLTITAAITKCTTSKGDRVFIRNGAYTEDLTLAKNGVQLIGESASDVIVTGATDATDVLIITGNECTIKNMQFDGYDSGEDISLIKLTGDGCRILGCKFAGNEYHIEAEGADDTLIMGNLFVTPDDATDGACVSLTDSNDCKVLFNGFFVDANSDGIIHHDADNLEVGWNCGVGDDDTGASAGCFVWITGSDTTSELTVHDNRVTLFAAIVGEDGAVVAAHGYGTSDITVANMVATGDGNNGLGCTVGFDTTD